jgi:hypothetical protein
MNRVSIDTYQREHLTSSNGSTRQLYEQPDLLNADVKRVMGAGKDSRRNATRGSGRLSHTSRLAA